MGVLLQRWESGTLDGRIFTAFLVLLSTGMAWLIGDGVLGYFGVQELLESFNPLVDVGVKVLLFVLSFALGSSGQALLTEWWSWFTQSWRHMVYGLLFILLWVIPTTAFNVAMGAVGGYTRLVDFQSVATIDWSIMRPALGIEFMLSVVAQQVAHLTLKHLLADEVIHDDGNQ